MPEPTVSISRARMVSLCREDARRVARIIPGIFAAGFCLEALFHWNTGAPVLVVVPVLCACSCLLLHVLTRRYGSYIRYPEWLLLVYWSQVQLSVFNHLLYSLHTQTSGTQIFLALSIAAAATLILPLSAMIFAVLASLTGYVYTVSTMPESNGISELAAPALVTMVSLAIHLARRSAIRQSEITQVLLQRVYSQNLDLTTTKRVHDAASTLAGGVAHHFNNKLQVVVAAFENARHIIGPVHAATHSLDQGLSASETLAQLVTRLQAYAGNLPVQLEQIPATGFLDVDKIRALVTSPERFHVEIEPTDARIRADDTILQAAVEELVKNAAQSTQVEGEVWLTMAVDNESCHIIVADTGTGFASVNKSQASEPFASSDPISRHGLGLSYVHGIVGQHAGKLRIEDRSDGGSQITITLPLARTIHESSSRGRRE